MLNEQSLLLTGKSLKLKATHIYIKYVASERNPKNFVINFLCCLHVLELCLFQKNHSPGVIEIKVQTGLFFSVTY